MPFKQFIFEAYDWNIDAKTLTLRYACDDSLHFTEKYHFDFELTNEIDSDALRKAFELLFFVAGVSYYKAYIPPEIVISSGVVDEPTSGFLQRTYQQGLGEFFFVNNLDPHATINFPVNSAGQGSASRVDNEGLLIGLGGGKDSLVTVEFLRDQPKVATWSLNHRKQLQPLVDRVGLPHFWVEREWDKQLLELNAKGAYNGHVPISAIFACVGVIVALLSGYRDVVVSNESSANEPTLQYQGVNINHQYSKSLAYEQDFQAVLSSFMTGGISYFSFLRPLTEVRIAALFARDGFDKYKEVFSSCNKAFTHDSEGLFWDGTCPKCAFVFLALTPFIAREKIENLFSGKNLLLDPELESTYKQLLGIEGDKPLECVGEIKESRAAMRLAQKQYTELSKYEFNLPADYDYRHLANHSMPPEIYALLEAHLHASTM